MPSLHGNYLMLNRMCTRNDVMLLESNIFDSQNDDLTLKIPQALLHNFTENLSSLLISS